MMTYTCPKGHELQTSNGRAPKCVECGVIATHYNYGSGKVYEWMTLDDYYDDQAGAPPPEYGFGGMVTD